ncbi:MAG: diacylglycerol kinase family protein [Candidatus Komeilibacteria bacterium]|nr:diacylglycerol kinase family protein [Candidatus Komeilibacteria bacterium]
MADQKILIIFNPRAGRNYPNNYRAAFLKQLSAYLPNTIFDWLETNYDLNQQLSALDLNNYTKIIVIGGDGTVKQTAEYILKHDLKTPLAIIPQGSANVLAGSLGIPFSQQDAIKVAALGKEKIIDVGLVNNEHYFLVGLSVGLLSQAVLETKALAKNRWGIFAYLLTLLKQVKPKQTLFNFQLDGQNYQVSGNTLLITNTFSLLKMKPRYWSDYTDGLLEVMVTQNKFIFGFLPIFLLAWLKRGPVPGLFVKTGRTVDVAQQSFDNLTVQLDGEQLEIKKIKATILPQRLRVITK